MNQSAANKAGAAEKRSGGATARVRGLVLGLVLFSAGIGLGAWWNTRAPGPIPAIAESGPPPLSQGTMAVLQRLGSPVEVRFYSLLDPASIPDSGRDFSGRVAQLLSQYDQQAGGRIKLVTVNSISTATAKAAATDGIKPFNMDKGDSCFLGITVVRGDHKASLTSLAPEWEQALESDLSRAIADVDSSDVPIALAAKADAATLDAVKHAIPNFESVSVEEGSRLLRLSSLAQSMKTAQETQAVVRQAEERFAAAESSQSAPEQEAALKYLQQVKTEQTRKLAEIAMESKAQVEALQQLKGAAH